MNGSNKAEDILPTEVESFEKPQSLAENHCIQKDVSCKDNVEGAIPAVIEISDDGTWETKQSSADDSSEANTGIIVNSETKETQSDTHSPEENCNLENVKIRHVTLAHNSQYYASCPVASVKPIMAQEPVLNGNVVEENQDTKSIKVDEILDNDIEVDDISTKVESRNLIQLDTANGANVTKEVVVSVEIIKEIPFDSCQCEEIEEQIHPGGRHLGSEELQMKNFLKTVVTLEEEILPEDHSCGDVVTDSILQNKEKTKTYWEEMMIAAANEKESPNRLRQSDIRAPDDGVEAHIAVYEATANGEEVAGWSPGTIGPKIVETVAKRIESREDIDEMVVRESVVELDIRQQKEREEALQRERKSLLSSDSSRQSSEKRGVEEWQTPSPTSPANSIQRLETPAEVKIALELREMREREEELRRLRQQLGLTKEVIQEVSESGEAFHSIPTTDEGNFSECGGEEKELGVEGIRSPIMSPDLPSLDMPSEYNCSFMHRRTQSTDSTSSGHSSGSGGPRSGGEYPPRRRIIVKPLADVEDDESHPPLLRAKKETPIEREIRIAREREEELRREKGLIQRPNQITTSKPEVPTQNAVVAVSHTGKSPQNVQLRLATNRIQREIQETTMREKELRDAGKIQTMSVDTVDSKVTRIGEVSAIDSGIVAHSKKLQKSVSASPIIMHEPIPSEPDGEIPPNSPAFTPPPAKSNPAFINRVSSPSSRKFTPMTGQKGIMERFLASRGKLTCISPFSSSSSSSPVSSPATPVHINSPAKTVTPVPAVVHKPIAVVSVDNNQKSGEVDPAASASTPHRRGWMSAEEKIQEELKQMKMREDELRLQRAHIMAQSQPNLLCIMDDVEESSQLNDYDSNMSSLYSTISNPNLLDLNGDDVQVKEVDYSQEQLASQKNLRRKSALIAQWESRIQQNTDN